MIKLDELIRIRREKVEDLIDDGRKDPQRVLEYQSVLHYLEQLRILLDK